MQKLLTVIVLLMCFSGWAQKPFQGTVIYSLTATGEKDTAELTVHFAPNKIIMKFRDKGEYEPKYNMVDFDSGKVYIVDDEDKTYRVRKLVKENKSEPVEARTILGYKTSPLVLSQSPTGGMLRNIMSNEVALHVSKDLHYPLDKRFAGVPELIFIQDNHIVLGGRVSMTSQFGEYEYEDEEEETGPPMAMVITAEAIKIEPKIFSNEEFRIPESYTKRKRFEASDYLTDSTMTDTTVVVVDSVQVQETPVTVPAPPKKSTQKPVAPEKTKPVKTEAVKRKKT